MEYQNLTAVRKSYCGVYGQVAEDAVQPLLVDVRPGECKQHRNQVSVEGARQRIRGNLPQRQYGDVGGRGRRHVPVCSVPCRHHHRPHQHAHRYDESLIRVHTGTSSRVYVTLSDVKFHEIFWREIFHEIFREIFLKYFRNFAMDYGCKMYSSLQQSIG